MIDLFWTSLGSTTASLIALAATGFALFDARRRIRILADKEALLPEAVNYPALKAEVEVLRNSKDQLLQESDEAKNLLIRKKVAEQWLEANQVAYERASRELPGLKAEIEMVTEDRDRQIAERDEAMASCDLIRRELQGLEHAIEPARQELQRFEDARSWMVVNREDYDRLVHDLPRLEKEAEELEGSITNNRIALANFEVSVKAKETERDFLLDEIERLQGIVNGLESDHTSRVDDISQLQARQAGLLSEVEQYRVQRDGALGELTQAQSELRDASRNLDRIREEINDVEVDRAVKLELVQSLVRTKKTLDEENQKLEEEKVRLTANIQDLRKEREAEVKRINDQIDAAMQRWKAAGGDDSMKLAELWRPVLRDGEFPIQYSTTNAGSEQESLERTGHHLEKLGLRFGQRVLNAFHTSLKVNEMSPLVVLAGISGTGKSELPRRYAEGMGIHSLTLAVQPRWDSPQDMFGFYNYLESRYRATELARALVQMDRYATERGSEWNFPDEWLDQSLSNRMLLVLLDEMNLARVEYYFSEFLSKLETRRGINRDNPSERRKAEIMLEVGLQASKGEDGKQAIAQQPTLPLFVDRNVLFVGTMNEDETTQTLSDKVVDRANVLRFGRPRKLGSGTNESESKPTNAWLPFDTWNQWVRSDDALTGQARSDVDGWVDELNHAMQSIGRPFAHRTYGAMLSYVANYPNPDQYKVAMADQIELKLLPKFRGLDPSDSTVRNALSTVQSVIDKVVDEKLSYAVREASKASEHQFIWHGVDRMDEP